MGPTVMHPDKEIKPFASSFRDGQEHQVFVDISNVPRSTFVEESSFNARFSIYCGMKPREEVIKHNIVADSFLRSLR